MVDDFERQYAEAVERGRIAAETEPRAASARYDRATGRVEIELKTGCLYAFPARLAQGLRDATPEQLTAVEVTPDGFGLHWEELDVDLTVPGLVAGVFGSERWMARLRVAANAP